MVGVAAGFVFEGLEGGGGEGAFAGEEEDAVFGGEEVVEFGLGEAEVGLAFGGESPFPDLELGGVFGLEGDFEEFLVGEGFEGAFEGGGGDVGGATEVVVADAAGALAASEMPEAEVDGLFGGTEIGEHGAQQFGEVHGVDIAWGRGEGEKGRGNPNRDARGQRALDQDPATTFYRVTRAAHDLDRWPFTVRQTFDDLGSPLTAGPLQSAVRNSPSLRGPVRRARQ